MTDFQTKKTFFGALNVQTHKQDYCMLRVRSLSQISEPKNRVQAAGRYGNLEAKPSR